MLRLDAASLFLVECLSRLAKEWKVRPAIVDDYVEKYLRKEKPVGLFEHLKRKYPSIAEEADKEIKSIYDVDTVFIERMLTRTRKQM